MMPIEKELVRVKSSATRSEREHTILVAGRRCYSMLTAIYCVHCRIAGALEGSKINRQIA